MTEDFEPRDEAEQQVVSRALLEERRAREDDERIESLSIRERLLIEEAWSEGASEENARIRKLLDNVERLEKRIKQLEDAIDRALKSRGFGWQMHGILADVRHTWPEE